jgi:hypothetical protein
MTQEHQALQPEASLSSYTVTAYQGAKVRPAPNTNGEPVSYVVAGGSYPAACWTEGETVTDNGITSDIWIRLFLNSGGVGYVSAIYLNGDSRANLPFDAIC